MQKHIRDHEDLHDCMIKNIFNYQTEIDMKKLQKAPSMITRFFALVALTFMSAMSWAQDQGLDIDVDVDGNKGGWYENPIIWVIGGAVFILLLVALLRSGKSDS